MRKIEYLNLLLIIIVMLSSGACANAEESNKLYYATDQNGITCGYAEVSLTDTTFEGRDAIYLDDRLELRISALGAEIIGKYRFEYWIDPATGLYFRHTSDINQGPQQMGGVMSVEGDSARMISSPGNDTTIMAIPPGTILQNTRLHRFLVKDFVENGLNEVKHTVFSEADGRTNDISYMNEGFEGIELAGNSYRAIKIDYLNRTTGLKYKMWVDSASGLLLKAVHPVRSFYLTDAGVKDRVRSAALDEHIFAKAGVLISDFKNVTHLKARLVCEPSGMWLTPEGLNVPGQKFEGTVDNNLVEGVFEITHRRYDGANAPPFPPDFGNIDSLAAYLKPTDMIECQAPELVEKAKEITTGAADSWEALKRLSKWVSDEISYDIPGGGTALGTFKARMGECGGHSLLLTAFCRAVGIPARVAFGCMYVPEYGGVFGQHAWNEIYMGDAGWIPVEATAQEIDYADCGHIRLGLFESKAVAFNPDTVEIIEYKIGGGEGQPQLTDEDFQRYLGEYQGQRGVMKILVQNNSLAIDIPGKMVFELNPPNDRGEWYFKITDAACVIFEEDESGNIEALTIDSKTKLPRRDAEDAGLIDEDTPDAYLPLVGAYAFPMRSEDITIQFEHGALSADIPRLGGVALEKSDEENCWVAELGARGKMILTFEFDNPDQASRLILSQPLVCSRIDTTVKD